MIFYRETAKTFYLNTKNSSYIIKILDNGMPCHWYYGKAVGTENLDALNLLVPKNYMPSEKMGDWSFSRNVAPSEYPDHGSGDFRTPAILTENGFGETTCYFVYKSHEITDGKPSIYGLPSFDSNTENVKTLEIVLEDTVSGMEVSLFYSVFEDEDAITRHTVVHNTSPKPIKIKSAQSLSIDFQYEKFEFITLNGAWAREHHITRRGLFPGSTSVQSLEGATGHQQNPFAALVSPHTTENSGEAYGFALVYSGNFKATADIDQFGSTRFQIGINPYNFSYELAAGESFTTPEAICVYSDKGLNGMSHCFHNMCRNHLGKCTDKTIKRPLLINSWEAMYFNMSEEVIEKFVSNCKGLGIDTFVLDDGWFGHRDSDNSSLGDWFIDKRKFPNGFNRIIKACKDNGMNFGLWFEPEMISRDSELFKTHPDWCIHVNNKVPTESRNQLVLDMSRSEVVDYTYKQVADILTNYDISYVKWDMNRNITDVGSPELSHRYILGVYELMGRLTSEFPNILFEGCAGGGGRFDFGILYYMPQIWTSDDTDAIERLKIQYGASLVYPLSAMTAHVSACPNHQTNRTTPFKTRGDVAQVCNFGYELDIAKLSDSEKAEIKEQVSQHRKIEDMIYNGDFYRLNSPFENDYCSWMTVSADKSRAFFVFATQKTGPHLGGIFVKLQGLNPDKEYTVKPMNAKFLGKTLMNLGIPIGKLSDFTTVTYEIIEE